MFPLFLLAGMIATEATSSVAIRAQEKSPEATLHKRLLLDFNHKEARLALAKAEYALALAASEEAHLGFVKLISRRHWDPPVAKEEYGLAVLLKMKHAANLRFKESEIQLAKIEITLAKYRLKMHGGK